MSVRCFYILQSSKISPEWKRLLDTVGVAEKELQDQDTARFIHDFVQRHGGIEEANRQLEKSSKAQVAPPSARTSPSSAVPPPSTCEHTYSMLRYRTWYDSYRIISFIPKGVNADC